MLSRIDLWTEFVGLMVDFLKQLGVGGVYGVGYSFGVVMLIIVVVNVSELFRDLVLIELVFLLSPYLKLVVLLWCFGFLSPLLSARFV